MDDVDHMCTQILTSDCQSAPGTRENDSLILKLNLSDQEFDALRTQGWLTASRRGRTSTIYRLHFRVAGQQITKYLGADRATAAAVSNFLAHHQQEGRAERRLNTRIRRARTLIRGTKSRLAPVLAAAGLHFHGNTIRRSRSPRVQNLKRDNSGAV